MSMILDALKRSRQDGEAHRAVPGIEAEHYIPPQASIVQWRWAWIALGFLSLVLVLGYAYGQFSGQRGKNSESMTRQASTDQTQTREVASPDVSTGFSPSMGALGDIPTPAAEAAVTVAATVTATSTATTKKVDADSAGVPVGERSGSSDATETGVGAASLPDRAAVAALYERASADPPLGTSNLASPSTEVPTLPVTASTIGAERRDTTVSVESARERDPVASPAAEESIDLEALVRQAQAALGEDLLEPHPATLLEDLSQQQKDRIPTLMYTLHDWDRGGQSSVVINGRRLQTGQRALGFRVEAILADSVVLEWSGITFRLRSLNSWVNM